ncbi:hypothetical protein COK88_24390 [Bacillus cereus]|uniref:hypothetical protein n=1 Tax=Bacillus cereus TaxID=1396 RepID=UPI000BF8FA8E|nr:hypothetical protein [Bacillus cereus]PFU46613.1 hypothetical protein COK88_24390 [Bacillus cereus]
MEENSIKEEIKKIMIQENVTYDQALDIYIERDAVLFDKMIEEEETEYEIALENLLKKPNRKTVIVHINKNCSKQQAMLIARNKIKVNSYHVISEINSSGLHRTLFASEYIFNYNEAQQILEMLNSSDGHYSDEEVEAIVTENIPFDIRK